VAVAWSIRDRRRCTIRRVLRSVLDLLVPPRCLACGAPGGDLCGACRRTLPWLADPRVAAPRASFSEAWAPLAHEGPARQLVVALKFRAATRAAHVMAAHLAQHRFAPGEVLVPVPTHPLRRRHRGFDHAVVLARALSRRNGVEVVECLRRGGSAERQLGSSRSRRLQAGRIALEVRGAAPQSAVLVDDVHTTGATLEAAARALKAAGSRNVRAVTYTRRLAS
jgi:ComF family protein